jgi:hypothetical protein
MNKMWISARMWKSVAMEQVSLYDSYMRTPIYPVALPEELAREVRQVAKKTGLSMADAMRQSMKLGLPKLLEELSLDKLTPMTEEERQLAYGTPNAEFDALEHHCARLPKGPPEED